MTRKIKIFTTAGMPGTIETNVTTLGALKPLLTQREINYNGMTILVGDTKNELSIDEATLPEGDFKIYLMPAKTKSGVDFDNMEDNVEHISLAINRIESKVESILAKLNASSNASSNATSYATSPTDSISTEDQREMEELQRLASSSSARNEWD